jgi:hypothetical protein
LKLKVAKKGQNALETNSLDKIEESEILASGPSDVNIVYTLKNTITMLKLTNKV